MSRTNRTNITNGNYREARKGRVNSDKAWQGMPAQRERGGGMLMSARSCGNWGDEYTPSTNKNAKTRERRNIKRGQRQQAMPEARQSA